MATKESKTAAFSRRVHEALVLGDDDEDEMSAFDQHDGFHQRIVDDCPWCEEHEGGTDEDLRNAGRR